MDFVFDPGLVLYLPLWKLDGASFASKDAPQHLCTVTGALWRPSGRWFDGVDDTIGCSNAAILNITDALTISIWTKWEGDWLAGTYMAIYKDGQYEIHNYLAVQTIKAQISLTGGNVTLTFNNPQRNYWYHLGLTYDKDSGNARLYVNGELIDEDTGTGTITSSASTLYIGAKMGSQMPFYGIIGDVLIFNRALTPQEIQRNYLATKWRYR